MNPAPIPEAIRSLERPDPALWTYYIIRGLLTGPALIGALPYLYFRYHTLRYRFDEEGIHMKVGILFRREVNLTYSRIQDIHLRSGILQRWLGLANVQIQTASGSSGPELVIEGFKEFESIRDFLYTRMRGYQSQHAASNPVGEAKASNALAEAVDSADLVAVLTSTRDELRRIRELVEGQTAPRPRSESSSPTTPPTHV